MKIIKIIGRSLAGFLVLLGLTVFIMSSFGWYAIDNISILEQDMTSNLGINMADVEKYCEDNQEDTSCKNNVLITVKKETSEFIYYGNMMKVFGFIFFIFGLLLFVWCNGWMLGLRSMSLVSTIGIFFSYIYYKFAITGTIKSFLPQEITNVIGNWINTSLNQVSNLILVLGITFLILTVWLYVKTKKQKSKEDIDKDES